MIKRRNRIKQILTLEERLSLASQLARDEARKMPLGSEREGLIRRARRHDVAAHMSAWLTSPGSRRPT